MPENRTEVGRVTDTIPLPGPDRPRLPQPSGLLKRFGDLKVRPKLMVLHNAFFLILAAAVYLAIIPAFEARVDRARLNEVSLVTQVFAQNAPGTNLPQMASYDFRTGSANEVNVPPDVKIWLDSHPGEVWQNTPESDSLFRKDPQTGIYRRVTLPNTVYDSVVSRAKWTLFLVLGAVYALAVLALELFIMPRYVYQPLRLMRDADRATQTGDRANELIPGALITADEIGEIMQSRNATITQLRRHEDDLAAAVKHLEAQDRLASLGLLSAGIAHEMNTPLAVLHGSIEKLSETVTDRTAHGRIQRMLRVTKRLQTISEGLVDFSRTRTNRMAPVAVRSLIEEAWALVGIDERASMVAFEDGVAPDDRVTGNADRLIQVFVNLLKNALEAVASTGRIRVTSTHMNRDGTSWLTIAVEDNGHGIPADVLPDIFGTFVSSRLDSHGTGLGLTVAEGIVHQHGGTITASNRPEGGARIEVTLRSAA